MKNYEYLLIGAGVLAVGGILFYSKKASAADLLSSGPLTPEVKQKVLAQVAASNDPTFLNTLAAGLYQAGATNDALNTLQKAADITGVTQSVPGALSLPTLTISPGQTGPLLMFYRVAAGDIPGAIAKRFGISLSQLGNANPAAKTRLFAGSIRTGETLAIPTGAVDKGGQSRATGTVS